ncbi:MAG: glutamyl-tRNA reductase, partial [Desulfobulbaceae bacterium]|nr:glutamyl-tRNA reductase [Desulfobulbaceae bacterium]
KFQQWLDGMDVTPTSVAIRHKADAIRLSEVEKTLGHLRDLTPKQVRAIEVLASSIVNKMLHHPITFLKAKGGSENQTQKLEMARRLFGLDLGSNEQDEDHLNE